MYSPIEDYGIIGNLRSAALISKDGSVDWKPSPHLDSPSVFAAILDEEKGGRWKVSPVDPYTSEQGYLGDTNILVTRFYTEKGSVDVTDFIPAQVGKDIEMEDIEKAEIHRKLECKKGNCSVKVEFSPRFDYARGETKLSVIPHGVLAEHESGQKGELVSSGEYSIEDDVATCTLEMKEGDVYYMAFHYHETSSEEWTPEHYEKELEVTTKFWMDWVHGCDMDECPFAGPWHDLAVRSSLVLKVLFFEPPGSIAAAATTSLPESIGGVRNWDYRFTWIRDSSFTLQALFLMGHVQEARRYVDWLLSECCSVAFFDPQNVLIMYGLRGEAELKEEILPHLSGYRDSKPVRIGNMAYDQKQWDIYGSLLDTVWRMHRFDPEYEISEHNWDVLQKFANYVSSVWREPDEGLWEVRGGKEHFTYSKVMCWVALDRALKIADKYGFDGEVEMWERERAAIREAVMTDGWSEEKQSFTQSFGSDELDSSVLLMPAVGFINGTDPRMVSTITAIRRELSTKNGLLLRYAAEDGLPGKEGAFLLSSFWLIDALVFAGETAAAERQLRHLANLANPVGLYSEEMHPDTLEFLGNFPQAYTHIGLINSVFYLSGALKESKIVPNNGSE